MSVGPTTPHTTPPPGPAGPRRTLVTGGAGFIGSHLVERLLERGDHVTVVDDLSTGSDDNLAPAHALAAAGSGPLTLVQGDLRAALPDLAAHADQEKPFDEIYHLAAAVGVGLVLKDPARAIEVNVEQTAAILRFAARTRSSILITSSSEVYGKPTRRVFSEEDDVVYGPTTIARWSYAATKAIDEYLALAHQRSHGLPTVCVRLFNTVGPRQIGAHGMVLPRMVEAALAGEPLTVHGDGTQTRCFCDVRDVSRAIPRMLAEPACEGRVLNLGSDRPTTIGELAELVVRVTGSSSPIRLIPYSDAYPEGFEDLVHRRPDLTRVREAIGFEPTIPLEQTIADVAEHMRRRNAAHAPRQAAEQATEHRALG